MAKHLVTCAYCKKQFDANQEEFIKVNSNRYAHKKCFDAAGGASPFKSAKPKVEKDPALIELNNYIYSLFGEETNWAMCKKQINQYQKDYKYSISGIHKSLIYFYEIKHGDKAKANGALGIVPFIYNDAYNYYLAIFMAQNQNQDKSFIQTIKEYIIKPKKSQGTKTKILNWGQEDEE